MPCITRTLLLTTTLLAGVGAANGQTITGRAIPSPLYGVALDDVSSVGAEIKALSQLIKPPTVRVVFDKGTSASYYKSPIQQLRGTAYIMGELIDSYYMKQFTSISSVQSWTNSYVTTLGSVVDVWEIGNEVNGSWLRTSPSVISKVEAMYGQRRQDRPHLLLRGRAERVPQLHRQVGGRQRHVHLDQSAVS